MGLYDDEVREESPNFPENRLAHYPRWNIFGGEDVYYLEANSYNRLIAGGPLPSGFPDRVAVRLRETVL